VHRYGTWDRGWSLRAGRPGFRAIMRPVSSPAVPTPAPGREAYHWPPQSSAEVNNAWSYTSWPPYVFMAWCLVQHRDNCTFTWPCEPRGSPANRAPYTVTWIWRPSAKVT
jgi:hypothetical protein